MSSSTSEWSISPVQSEQTGEFDAVEVADAVANLSSKLVRLRQQIRTLRRTQSKPGSPESSSSLDRWNELAPQHWPAEQDNSKPNNDDQAETEIIHSNSSSIEPVKAHRIRNSRATSLDDIASDISPPTDQHLRKPVALQKDNHRSKTADSFSSPKAAAFKSPGLTDDLARIDKPIRTPSRPKADGEEKKESRRTGRKRIKRISRGVQSEQTAVSSDAPVAGKPRLLLRLFRSKDTGDEVVGDSKGRRSARIAHEKISEELSPTAQAKNSSRDDGLQRKNNQLVLRSPSAHREKGVEPIQSDNDEGFSDASSSRSMPQSDADMNEDSEEDGGGTRRAGGARERPRIATADGDYVTKRRWPLRREQGGASSGPTTSRNNKQKKLEMKSRRRRSVTLNDSPEYIEDKADGETSSRSSKSEQPMRKNKPVKPQSKKRPKVKKEKVTKSLKKDESRHEKKRKKEEASKSKGKEPDKTRGWWKNKSNEKRQDTKKKVKTIGSKAKDRSKKVDARRKSADTSTSSKKNSSLNLDKKAKKLNLRKPKTESIGVQAQNQTVLSSLRQRLKNLTHKNESEKDPKKSISSKSLKSNTSQNGKKTGIKKKDAKMKRNQTEKGPKKDVKRRQDTNSSLKEKFDKFSNDRQYHALKKRLTFCAGELNQLVVKVSDLFHKKRIRK